MIRNTFRNSRLAVAVAVFAAAAVLFFAWGRLGPTPLGGEPGSAASSARTGTPTRQVYFGPRNSLAVLPFSADTASSEVGPEAFGFSANLSRVLGRLPSLQITAPTSSFFFASGSTPPRIIGERLQSAHLLSGELRVVEGTAIVKAKLVDARSGNELWSEEFAGTPSSLLAVRDQLVAAVGKTLRAGATDMAGPTPSIDGNAWLHYLRGLYFDEQLGGSDPQAAVDAFGKAVGLQMDFASAWAGLAEAWLSPAWPKDSVGPDLAKARAAIGKALEVSPVSAEALGLRAQMLHSVDWDFPGAAEAAVKAVELEPADAGLMAIASRALFTMGEFGEAERLLQESIARDPLNLRRRLSLGLLQEFSGEYEGALTTYRVLLGLNPEFPGAHAYRARIKVIQGKGESALKESDAELAPFWKDYSRVLGLIALGREEEAQALLDRMIEEHREDAAYQIAELQAFRGEVDAAFEWLGRAEAQHDAGMSELKGNFFLSGIHHDPRWRAMLEKLRLPLD